MEIYRDLYIHCNGDQFAALMADVEQALEGGWARDGVEEQRLLSLPAPRNHTVCFSCSEQQRRPAATVFLMERDPGLFHASNVVPRKTGQLTYREYNGLLEELHGFLKPCADKRGVRTELTAPNVDLEEWLTTEAAHSLRRFSDCSHKGSGASHPADRERWNEFVVAAHEGKCQLRASTLARWLSEVEGWPGDIANQLAIEYESGRELLAFADARRRSA